MEAILQLLEGSPEQRDCGYHLFFYRNCEFPSIMRSIRTVDDPQFVSSFLERFVLVDLETNVNPILVADSLISCDLFVNYIAVERVMSILQRCVTLLTSPSESVRVLSVITIDRILTRFQMSQVRMIDSCLESNSQNQVITPSQLEPLIVPLTNYLLTVSMPLKQTDHYLIKTYLRIVLFMNEHVHSSEYSSTLDSPIRQRNATEIGGNSCHVISQYHQPSLCSFPV